ncbi:MULTISPECIES: hypothetical protein [unclassified Nonomuraea]|uniref:hypothetical protein n=1 Tax=unclassified Nonomuraea TaxID=2593643 RepID=UPI0013776015|nr:MULTISPECIES: hypothetical protein [unclassified Nonomuraea]NBE98723.1 hypothetical protein [Nonomuraea sp. K271]
MITRDVEPEIVMGVMGTIRLIAMNQHMYGDTHDVLDATINAIARGMVTSNGD